MASRHEPISEEFYRELWETMTPGSYKISLDNAKKQGCIKKSREEEIREKLKAFETIEAPMDYVYSYNCALELIAILDNQIKELRNQ